MSVIQAPTITGKIAEPRSSPRRHEGLLVLCLAVTSSIVIAVRVHAHNGPPFPIVTDRTVGNYVVSLWADPDVSDEGDADGRFWLMVNPAAKGTALPAGTTVLISIWPVEHREAVRTDAAKADEHEPSRRAAAFVIDREGKYGVKATIAGPLGPGELETIVDAQYDQRPRPILIAVFALPFVLIGFVWIKLLLRRRANRIRAEGQRSGFRG